mmetsp:Transcript_77605/g.179960  ORF Transcript_77605/g.179960 Transcript_77605/m.179960 type:complete len:315 (+) Transcript_77605:1478-2422(+)
MLQFSALRADPGVATPSQSCCHCRDPRMLQGVQKLLACGTQGTHRSFRCTIPGVPSHAPLAAQVNAGRARQAAWPKRCQQTPLRVVPGAAPPHSSHQLLASTHPQRAFPARGQAPAGLPECGMSRLNWHAPLAAQPNQPSSRHGTRTACPCCGARPWSRAPARLNRQEAILLRRRHRGCCAALRGQQPLRRCTPCSPLWSQWHLPGHWMLHSPMAPPPPPQSPQQWHPRAALCCCAQALPRTAECSGLYGMPPQTPAAATRPLWMAFPGAPAAPPTPQAAHGESSLNAPAWFRPHRGHHPNRPANQTYALVDAR